jgi:hypothetical protein
VLLKSRIGIFVIFGLIANLSAQCSVFAQVVSESAAQRSGNPSIQVIESCSNPSHSSADASAPLIAQANGASTAAEVAYGAISFRIFRN